MSAYNSKNNGYVYGGSFAYAPDAEIPLEEGTIVTVNSLMMYRNWW
jgi:hypothetical protein